MPNKADFDGSKWILHSLDDNKVIIESFNKKGYYLKKDRQLVSVCISMEKTIPNDNMEFQWYVYLQNDQRSVVFINKCQEELGDPSYRLYCAYENGRRAYVTPEIINC